MSENTLKTVFIFDSETADRRINETERRLFALNTDLNNLGKGLTLGKTIADDLGLAGKSVEDFKTKTNGLNNPTFGDSLAGQTEKTKTGLESAGKGADNLKRKTEDLSKPTFGGAYYEESKKTNAAFESAKTAADSFKTAQDSALKSTAGLPDAGKNSLKEIAKFYDETSNTVSKGIPNNALYNEIEKSRLSVQKLNGQRLDGKNFDGLTQSGVRLHTELGRVQTDVLRLNSALSKTTDKNLIKILNEDLSVAESKFNRLNAQANRFTKSAPSGGGIGGAGSDKFHRIQGYGAVIREFAPEGINESVLNAGGQLAAAAGIGTATLAVFGGIAAAGALIVKVTQDIRAEAERHLKVEENINGEINKQLLAGIELKRQFAEQRANAERGDNFSRSLRSDETIEQLTRRKQRLEDSIRESEILKNAAIFTKNFGGVDVQKLENNLANDRRELLETEKGLRDISFEKNNALSDAFNKHNEDFKKSQADDAEFGRKRDEDAAKAAKKRADDLEKVNKKVKELGKTYTDTFDNLNQKLNAENPVALAFAEGKKELDALKESLRGLSPELQNQAVAIQNKLNGNALFNARLDNDFAAFDLKQRASELRDFKTPKIDDPQKFFADFVADGLKQAIAANGGSGTRFNRLGNGGFSQSSIENEFSTNFNRVSNKDGSLGGFSQSARSFADLTNREKFDFLNKDNVGAQNKLSAAFDLAGNREKLNDDQQSAIDRKILSLSGTFRPDQLNDRQRDIVATAAENEAKRKSEKEDKSFEVQVKIEAHLAKLREIAEKGGENALKIILQDETESGATADFLPARPQGGATRGDGDYKFTGFGIGKNGSNF